MSIRRTVMKAKNIFRLIAFLALIVCVSVTLEAQEGRGKGRVKGSCMDEAGNPIEDVTITAQHLKYNTTFEGRTNKEGHWAVAGLGTGYFRFTATKEGYGTTYHEMRVSQFSQNNPAIDFTLKKIDMTSMSEMPAIEDETALALFEEGNLLFEEEKYAEAVKKFEEFLELNPTIFQVNLNIGNCYRQIGEYDKAIAAYQAILDQVTEEQGSYEGDEGASRALSSMGETYMLKGDLEKASEYLQKAMSMFPDDETLAFNVGEIFFNQAETDKAIEYFKKAIEIKEDWPPPYRQLGYAYLNKGEYQLAIDSLKKFLEYAPDDPQAPTIEALIPKLEELIKK
jgi:tetratricopeptide (TPR) repeat protein